MTATMATEYAEHAQASLGDLLREIGACEDATTQGYLVEDFLRLTEPMNKGIGAALCRDFKADRNTWLDDFIQIVRESAMHLLREIAADPERADEVESYRALLHFRSRSAATKFIDSSAGFNQASGMAGIKRRVRELERTRAFLYQQGVEPTDEMIVQVTNERMAAARSDYKRQGMECSIEDLQVAETTENIEDHSHPVSVDAVETDAELHATERAKLVYLCIAACDADSTQLGQIARLWFRPALDDNYDAHPTAADIAKQIGIEASTARAKVAKVRNIARHVAREQFGIRSSDDS